MKKQINAFRTYKPVEGELVRVIKLNVRIGNIILRDQLEWDINNPFNSPEVLSLMILKNKYRILLRVCALI
jgi:hypothetical protein